MLVNLAVLALFAYGLLLLAVYLGQSRLLYLPDRHLAASPADRGLPFEEVFPIAADGVLLHGWYLPHPEPRGAVLFLHGNAGDIGDRIDTLAVWHDLGLAVLIIDYRGYGRSDGAPSEEGLHLDAVAAWEALIEKGFTANRIVVHGRSLGGAVAARLASQQPAAGLILEATFDDLVRLAGDLYPWLPVRWLARLRYPTAGYAARYPGPILVVHSPGDEIIGFDHAERLLAATAPRSRLLRLSGGHNDAFIVSGHHYLDGLDRFVEEALSR